MSQYLTSYSPSLLSRFRYCFIESRHVHEHKQTILNQKLKQTNLMTPNAEGHALVKKMADGQPTCKAMNPGYVNKFTSTQDTTACNTLRYENIKRFD